MVKSIHNKLLNRKMYLRDFLILNLIRSSEGEQREDWKYFCILAYKDCVISCGKPALFSVHFKQEMKENTTHSPGKANACPSYLPGTHTPISHHYHLFLAALLTEREEKQSRHSVLQSKRCIPFFFRHCTFSWASACCAPAEYGCNSTRSPLKAQRAEAKQQMRNHPQICRKQRFGMGLVCNQHCT